MQVRQNTAPTARQPRTTHTTTRRLLAGLGTAALALGVGAVVATPVSAATVTSAVFKGGAGTVPVGGTLYAKQGAALTLDVATSSDTKCVEVAGATTLPRQTSTTGQTAWSFTTTAPAGNGAQAFTVSASEKALNNNCTGGTATTQASYALDNTGPVVSATLTPAANAAGWNNTDVTVRWSAADAGSGVSGAQPFKTETVTANGIATLTVPAQADRLGNTGAPGSATVRVDKASPSITASQTKNADGTTTITFTCADAHSGVASCLADGSTTNAKTVQPGVTVTGTATDKAGNTSTASSTAPKGDTTAPTLTGAPTTQPNGAGWYRDDVTVHWSAADPESGIPTQPGDTTITGEGEGLTSTTSVTNGAGLTTTATSTPAVRIDRTAPKTTLTGASNAWVHGDVTLTLAAGDGLSGVASTRYAVDGGEWRTGSSIVLDSEGEHQIAYASTDRAGNTEATRTATVRIDTTAPTISHTFDPTTYEDGAWTNGPVTVTFTCADQGGSGVADCTAPVTKTAEGVHTVPGTATDNAGNAATDTATVLVDTTPPTVTATASGEKNAAGWYRHDVRVEYTATDALSGVASAPKPDVLAEGKGQSASGTAKDRAGNTASAGVSGINVDTTAPTLTGSFQSGWHTDDVTVAWTCTDALSGPAAQPADGVVTGEGEDLTATASCADEAGNTTTETVDGIRIDRHAPTTKATVSETASNGWYRGTATVTLTAADNLSGVATTTYTVNGGTAKAYDGPITFTEDGSYTVAFLSKDRAGNVEKASSPLVVAVDGTAPTTTVVNPISPESGWFVTSGIPFAFTASDAHAGVAATYYAIDGGAALAYGAPFTENLSTGSHTVEYWSEDGAGNAETKRTFRVNVDTAKPTIAGATVDADGKPRAANPHGWFNSAVDVKFTCDDEGSGLAGIAGCAGDTTLTNDGADQYVTGTAVDLAGNKSSERFGPVNLDTVAPTLTGVPSAGNAAGWHKGNVTVTWVGNDGLSGIDPDTQPEPTTVTGEGANLTAGPATIRDMAGNASAPATVGGIKIDRTAPVVAGAATTKPNADGWYSGEVVVDFTCTDALSGVASCPTSQVLRADGANQSVTSGPATDLAGNSSTGLSVGGINIDGTAPTSTSNNLCTATNGWCTGKTADVALSATDQAGLSGVKEIRYRIDGGTEQVKAGDSATVSVPLDGSGAGTVSYWAVDKAGNAEKPNSVALKWDNIAPTVSHTLSPAPNADTWNNADVTVTFSAKDDDKGSGVASVTSPVTVSTETGGKEVTGSATDTAGNTGTDKVTVKLDKTLPTITGAVTDGTKGAGGWYTGPVTVRFTCADTLSGVATCPDPVVLTANGDDNAASGTVTDKAGNQATATVGGIRIDQEKPTLTAADVNVEGRTFTLGAVPAATCTATDRVSGLASCAISTSGGTAGGVGAFTYTASATDRAGNVSQVSGTYRVVYRFDGFLQPINDTAHQVGTSTSVFKAGSTVPAKLQLKKADGTVVQAAAAPVWLTPVKGSSMSAPVDETVYTGSADSGTTYRLDATAGQYIYNWKTGTAGGNYWRVGVKLDDGETYFVNIGTR